MGAWFAKGIIPYVFYHYKPLHPKFIFNMTLETVYNGIIKGSFFEAIETKKE